MYDCTAKLTSAGEDVSRCRYLHDTVKQLITRSFANMPLENVPDGSGAECNLTPTASEEFKDEVTCSPADLGILKLAMQDLEFSDLCAELTGCFDQEAGLPIAANPGPWDSHPIDPLVVKERSLSHAQAMPRIDHIETGYCLATTPVLSNLPLPSSHAYLEPTFSRRLVRLLWEYAFKVLTYPNIPMSQLNRCFGFCLRARSKDTLVRKFKAYLGLSHGLISELDRQSWNAAPDVRDSMDAGSDEREYWLEAGKVESYLESLGFYLADSGEANVKITHATMQNTGARSAPQIPYGSSWHPNFYLTDMLFDSTGNFQVPASWLTPTSEAVVTPESLVAAECSTYLNAERLVQPKSGCYLDVDRFFAGMCNLINWWDRDVDWVYDRIN
jgi:hypothetical protein